MLPLSAPDAGAITINGYQYTVTVLRGAGRATIGYRPAKADGIAYDLSTNTDH
jgi:hypothetical protein